MIRRCALVVVVAAVLCSDAVAATNHPIYYRPGSWVEIPASSPGVILTPGAATVVGEERAEAQYALPLSDPWAATFGDAKLGVTAVPAGAWLVAELAPGAGSKTAPRDGILKALPAGSMVVPLSDVRRRVSEAVDLIVCYDFSESNLRPQEQAAVAQFVRRGGAVLLIFASRAIPAASVDFWRSLFGADGEPERQAAGLPRGLLVAADFTLRLDHEMPRLVRRQCGRGVVLAYGMAPSDNVLKDPDATAKLFARAMHHIRNERRPLAIGPVEPDVFAFFGRPEWSAAPRQRFVLLAWGYAAAAVGLVLSFGRFLMRGRWAWVAGLALVAAAGIATVVWLASGASGLALETTSMLILEPGANPVMVTFARIARLGPGSSPELRSPMMPPKLVLYSRYSAAQKNWVNYRFRPAGPTVEPLLDVGQNLCLVSIRPVFIGSATAAPPELAAHPPPNADKLVRFFKERWASKDTDYTFSWTLQAGSGPFRPDAPFVQVDAGPTLVVSGARTAPEPPSP